MQTPLILCTFSPTNLTTMMLFQATGDVYTPTAGDLVLMLTAGIAFFIILFWRRLAPGAWRSKLATGKIKKTWLLMATEDQKVAFTKLIVEAAKSDGKVTGDEGEAIFEEMNVSYKKAAQEMSQDNMYEVLNSLDAGLKKEVLNAVQELLNSDGEFAHSEAEWLAGVVKRLS